MTKEALRLGIESLEWHNEHMHRKISERAILAMKEALAQPEQEPVAWMKVGGMKAMPALEKEAWLSTGREFDRQCVEDYTIPLYTTPPQRKPLTKKEVLAIIDKHPAEKKMHLPMFYRDQVLDIARAIEAAHNIK